MKDKLDVVIREYASPAIFFPGLLCYFIGFLVFGLVMGSGFVAAAVAHFFLYYSNLE